jgi:hypothetical protein
MRDEVSTPASIKRCFIGLLHDTQQLQFREPRQLEAQITHLLPYMKTCDVALIREIFLGFAIDAFFGCPKWGEHAIMETPPSLSAINEAIEPVDHGIFSREGFERVRQRLRLLIPFAWHGDALDRTIVEDLLRRLCIWCMHREFCGVAFKILRAFRKRNKWFIPLEKAEPIFSLMKWHTDALIKPSKEQSDLFKWAAQQISYSNQPRLAATYVGWAAMAHCNPRTSYPESLSISDEVLRMTNGLDQSENPRRRHSRNVCRIALLEHLPQYLPEKGMPSYLHLLRYTEIVAMMADIEPTGVQDLKLVMHLHSWKNAHFRYRELFGVLLALVLQRSKIRDFIFSVDELVQFMKASDLGGLVTELVGKILEYAVTEDLFLDTKFPHLLIQHPQLPTSMALSYAAFHDKAHECCPLSVQPTKRLHLCVTSPGPASHGEAMRVSESFLETANTHFEIIFRNGRYYMSGLYGNEFLCEDPPPPPSPPPPSPLPPKWEPETVYRFGLHVTPMTNLSEFLLSLPGDYQPVAFETGEDGDTLMGTVLGIGLDRDMTGSCTLDCPFRLVKDESTGGHQIYIGHARPHKPDDPDPSWHSSITFDQSFVGISEIRTVDAAVSLEMLGYLSNPSIGVFAGAYAPILEHPRIFSLEVRSIAWMMLTTRSSGRVDLWTAIFIHPRAPPVFMGRWCRFHPAAQEIFAHVEWEHQPDTGGWLHGVLKPMSAQLDEYNLRQLGVNCAHAFVHGCGFPTRPFANQDYVLSASITSTASFRKGVEEVRDADLLFRLFTAEDIGVVVARRQRWYPGIDVPRMRTVG